MTCHTGGAPHNSAGGHPILMIVTPSYPCEAQGAQARLSAAACLHRHGDGMTGALVMAPHQRQVPGVGGPRLAQEHQQAWGARGQVQRPPPGVPPLPVAPVDKGALTLPLNTQVWGLAMGVLLCHMSQGHQGGMGCCRLTGQALLHQGAGGLGMAGEVVVGVGVRAKNSKIRGSIGMCITV